MFKECTIDTEHRKRKKRFVALLIKGFHHLYFEMFKECTIDTEQRDKEKVCSFLIKGFQHL